jgi:hypothetical protein
MFRYRFRSIAAWPDEWSFPLSPGGAPGVSSTPFAGLLPHTGGGSFPIKPGPPACSSSRTPRCFFVGLIHRVDRKHESGKCCGESRVIGLASGLRSRLRSVSAGFVADESFLPWAFPPSGLRAPPMCIRSGSTPLESPSRESVIRAFMPLVGLRSRSPPHALHVWWLCANFPSAYRGLMPGPSGQFRDCPERASCLRFCTCRERDARHRDSRRGAQPI